MAEPAEFAVHPGGERLVACRAQYHHVNVVFVTANAPNPGELVEHALVEAVEDLGPVQCDRRDVVGHLEQDGFEAVLRGCHRLSLGSIRTRSASMVLSISSVPPAMR